MLNKNELFSFTFLFNDENDKVILIKQGDIPVKELTEADQVLSSDNKEDKSSIEGIISKIPVFEAAEPGSEVMITETLGDLEDKYGISIEELEEEVGEDFNNDQEKKEHTEHIEKALDKHLEDKATELDEEIDECNIDTLTDPSAIIPRYKSSHTQPIDFLDEDDGYEDIFTAPEIIAEGVEMIEEGASMSEAIGAFVREIQPGKPYYSKEINNLFSTLSIYDRQAQIAILKRLPATNNIIMTKDENGVSCLERNTDRQEYQNIRADDALIYGLLGLDGSNNRVSQKAMNGAQNMLRPKILRY